MSLSWDADLGLRKGKGLGLFLLRRPRVWSMAGPGWSLRIGHTGRSQCLLWQRRIQTLEGEGPSAAPAPEGQPGPTLGVRGGPKPDPWARLGLGLLGDTSRLATAGARRGRLPPHPSLSQPAPRQAGGLVCLGPGPGPPRQWVMREDCLAPVQGKWGWRRGLLSLRKARFWGRLPRKCLRRLPRGHCWGCHSPLPPPPPPPQRPRRGRAGVPRKRSLSVTTDPPHTPTLLTEPACPWCCQLTLLECLLCVWQGFAIRELTGVQGVRQGVGWGWWGPRGSGCSFWKHQS